MTDATAVRTERRAISAFSFGVRRARVFRGGEGAAEIVFAKGKSASAAGPAGEEKTTQGRPTSCLMRACVIKCIKAKRNRS